MADFRQVYDGKVGAIEGEYADIPGDTGGRTWKGISENNNPGWRGWEIIDAVFEIAPHLKKPANRRNLNTELRGIADLEDATRELLKFKYWDVFWGDLHNSHFVAGELYDQTVHFGSHTSIKHLQRVLNVLNRRQQTHLDLVPDGVYGYRTHRAVTAAAAGGGDVTILLLLNCLQGARYVMLAERNPNDEYEDWIRGFARRL